MANVHASSNVSPAAFTPAFGAHASDHELSEAAVDRAAVRLVPREQYGACVAAVRTELPCLPSSQASTLETTRGSGRAPWVNAQRRGPESNRRIAVLQTAALPLGYRAE